MKWKKKNMGYKELRQWWKKTWRVLFLRREVDLWHYLELDNKVCINFLVLPYQTSTKSCLKKKKKFISSHFSKPEVWNQGDWCTLSRTSILKFFLASPSFWGLQAFFSLCLYNSNFCLWLHMDFSVSLLCLSLDLRPAWVIGMISSWDH